jgi:uncharacterized protein YbjT (DUF2867 family)
MNIAVLGATGLIGKPVTQQLLDAGFAVTILARHPDQAQVMFPKARVVQADLRNPASIRAGLEGQQALYLSLSVKQSEKSSDFHTETDGMKTVIEAARQVGVQRIGYLSSLVMRYQGINGFSWWVFDVKHEAVRLLKESGIPTTIFYPSTFMESFQMQTKGPFVALGGSSAVKLWFIAGADFGEQVVQAFQQMGDQNRDYVIQGPEAHTYEAAAHLFAQHSRKKLWVLNMPVSVLKFFGRFNQTMNYGGYILDAMNNYPERFEATQTWNDLGKPGLTIQEFAKQV